MPTAAPAGDNPTSPPNANQLLGSDAMSTQPGSMSSTEADANRQFVTLIRAIHNELDTLTRMRPEFSQYARAAKKALMDGMVKSVAGQGGRAGAASQPMPQ
jgi:hypothetical protein